MPLPRPASTSDLRPRAPDGFALRLPRGHGASVEPPKPRHASSGYAWSASPPSQLPPYVAAANMTISAMCASDCVPRAQDIDHPVDYRLVCRVSACDRQISTSDPAGPNAARFALAPRTELVCPRRWGSCTTMQPTLQNKVGYFTSQTDRYARDGARPCL